MDQRINEVLAIPSENVFGKLGFTEDHKKLIASVYFDLTGTRLKIKHGGCQDCFERGYLYIKSQYKPKQKTMKSQFKLKSDRILNVHGVEPFSNANITDEKALKVLKANPNAIKLFSDHPENWRKLIDGFDPMQAIRETKKEEVAKVNPKELEEEQAEETNDEDAEKSRRELLEEKSNKELKELCENMELPEAEWKKLNSKVKLIDYIVEKTK